MPSTVLSIQNSHPPILGPPRSGPRRARLLPPCPGVAAPSAGSVRTAAEQVVAHQDEQEVQSDDDGHEDGDHHPVLDVGDLVAARVQRRGEVERGA